MCSSKTTAKTISIGVLFTLALAFTIGMPTSSLEAKEGEKDTAYTRKMHEVLKLYNKANKSFYTRKYDNAKSYLEQIFPKLDELKPLAMEEGYLDTKKNEKIYDTHLKKLQDGLHELLDLVDNGKYDEAKKYSTSNLSATCNACHKKGEQKFPGFGTKPERKRKH